MGHERLLLHSPDSTALGGDDGQAVLRQVCRLIADILERTNDEVRPDDNVITDLGMDSLSILSLFISLKRMFQTPEPGSVEEYQALSTPRLIASYVQAGLNGRRT